MVIELPDDSLILFTVEADLDVESELQFWADVPEEHVAAVTGPDDWQRFLEVGPLLPMVFNWAAGNAAWDAACKLYPAATRFLEGLRMRDRALESAEEAAEVARRSFERTKGPGGIDVEDVRRLDDGTWQVAFTGQGRRWVARVDAPGHVTRLKAA